MRCDRLVALLLGRRLARLGRGLVRRLGGLERLDLRLDVVRERGEGPGLGLDGRRRQRRRRRGRGRGRRDRLARDHPHDGGVARAALQAQERLVRRRWRLWCPPTLLPGRVAPLLLSLPHPGAMLPDERQRGKGRSVIPSGRAPRAAALRLEVVPLAADAIEDGCARAGGGASERVSRWFSPPGALSHLVAVGLGR